MRWRLTITLDGFMDRPNDSLDWANKYANDEMTKGITAEIGAVVMGKGRYNPAEDGYPMDEKPKCHNSSLLTIHATL